MGVSLTEPCGTTTLAAGAAGASAAAGCGSAVLPEEPKLCRKDSAANEGGAAMLAGALQTREPPAGTKKKFKTW